jgi:hypothetical protein
MRKTLANKMQFYSNGRIYILYLQYEKYSRSDYKINLHEY